MRRVWRTTWITLAAAGALAAQAPSAEAKDDDPPPTAEAPEQVKPGQTRLLTAPKGMRYFLRVPKGYDAKKGARAIVWLHGSNMNGMQYVSSFEGANWCDDAILVCPNGEDGKDPLGQNNFTFGSGPLVADLTEQVRKAFRTTATYVGGHSQGAFLTYSVVLHFPDLYQGAVSFAGDCWMQNEPNLWEDRPDVLEKQMRIPVAVIHGRDDPLVDFKQGQHAYDCFRGMGWPRLRMFDPDGIGHMFLRAPIVPAFEWLDAMNGLEEKRSLDLVGDWMKDGEWSWAVQAAEALAAAKGATAAAKSAPARVAKAADAPAKKAVAEMQAAMAKEEPLVWVPRWMEFRRRFGATAAAKALCSKYDAARDKERADGARLFDRASGLFRANQRAEAYGVLEELLKEAPHTYHAFYGATWLAERDDGGKDGKDRKKR